MKILIINQPLNNRGDESAHKALVRELSKSLPNVIIQIPYPSNRELEMKPFIVKAQNVEYIPIHFFKGIIHIQRVVMRYNLYSLAKLHPALRQYCKLFSDAEWVICAPGGICLGGFQNWGHLFFLMLARNCGSKIAYYGRSIGPFPTATPLNREFKQLSLDLLSSVDYLSIRDKKSEEIAQDEGLRYYSTVDTAFLDYPQTDIPEDVAKEIEGGGYMVFVPNVLIWHFFYRGKVSKSDVITFYKELIKRVMDQYPDLKILMLPQIYNPVNGDSDAPFFKELAENFNGSRIIVVNEGYNSDIQQSIIRNARFIVGARYHSIVFAINNNVPFVALSYEHKISGLLRTLGKEDRVIDITTAFNSTDNMSRVYNQFEEKIHILKKDSTLQKKAKETARSSFSKLLAIIK